MERAGFMNGNRFKMYFINNTQISALAQAGRFQVA